jgi:hypothetical protein
MEGWQEQWGRVEIGLARVKNIYDGREGPSSEALYDLYSFFLNAHHLPEWLVDDSTSKVTKAETDALVDQSGELSVCAAMGDRLKHRKLTSKKYVTKQLDQTDLVSRSVTIMVGGGPTHSFVVAGRGKSFDALELAQAVRDAWHAFLVARGLL